MPPQKFLNAPVFLFVGLLLALVIGFEIVGIRRLGAYRTELELRGGKGSELFN
jgi:hypothetical protein